MRRAAVAVVSTIAALVMLLSFKSHSSSLSLPRAAAISTPSAGTPSTTSSGTKTVTGNAYDTPYGPVQVQITLSNGRLTNVAAMQLPSGNGRDIFIDNNAVPILQQEALAAQSAQIDMVSGATYTSQGYIQSLQSALDKAKA